MLKTAERQWGDDLIASWNKHGWIDWPTQIAAKLAPIVGAKPNELLIADFDQRLPVQAARGRGRARGPGRTTILTRSAISRPTCMSLKGSPTCSD